MNREYCMNDDGGGEIHSTEDEQLGWFLITVVIGKKDILSKDRGQTSIFVVNKSRWIRRPAVRLRWGQTLETVPGLQLAGGVEMLV